MSFQLNHMHDLDLKQLQSCDLLIVAQSSEPRGYAIPTSLAGVPNDFWVILQSTLNRPGPQALSSTYPGATPVGIESVTVQLTQWLRNNRTDSPKVVIDVSCMSRPAMAAVFEPVFRVAAERSVTLVVGYVIASYSPPPASLPPNEDIKPISDWFAGWPSDATASTALVVGLGYERAKAEGACEYFDASETWVLVPRSPLLEYDNAVVENNTELLARARQRGRSIDYKVDCPTETFGYLASTVSRLLPRINPVLLPFGPKIYFAVNLLIAAIYSEAGVWHVTGDVDTPETTHAPSDHWVAFQADLSPHITDSSPIGLAEAPRRARRAEGSS